MIEGIRRNVAVIGLFAIAIVGGSGFVFSQSAPRSASVQVAATQATLTIALWEDRSYMIRTAPGQPPAFDPVTIAYIKLGDVSPVPNPDPNPPPAPSTLTARGKAIREAALKATSDSERAVTAQKLAIFYEQVAIKIRANEIAGIDHITALSKAGADILLVGESDAWKPFRDTLTAQATALAQESGDNASFAKLFDEVRDGLLSTVPQEAIDREKWLKIIMEIITMIMRIWPAEAFK